MPSAVSAIKVDGKRAYKLAREGQTVELAARPVRIDRFDVLAVRRHRRPSSTSTSRWTARRAPTSARWPATSARTLGVGGHLTALRRTRVGRFRARPGAHAGGARRAPRLSYSLDEACLLAFPRRDLTGEEAEDRRHGRALEPAGIDGVYAATAPDGRVIALLTDEASRTKSVVVIRPATL